MSASFVDAANSRHAESVSSIDTLEQELAAGRISASDFAKSAREAGASVTEVANVLRKHAVAGGGAAADATSSTPQTMVDVSEGSTIEVTDDGGQNYSLHWLKKQGVWGVRAVERLGADNDFLYSLDLYDGCDIDAVGARHIARALRAHCVLTDLNMNSNRIGDEGVVALSEALIGLADACELKSLHLQSNGIGARGAAALAGLLEANKSLRLLDVSGNALGADGVSRLRKAWGTRDPKALQCE